MTISNYYDNENPKISEMNLGRSQLSIDAGSPNPPMEYEHKGNMGSMGMNLNRNNYL